MPPVLGEMLNDEHSEESNRFFACKDDLSLEPPDTPLPEAVVNGTEPFLVVGAMAGG